MVKFEDHLKRWNGGVRGAQARLARALRIDQSNIRRWVEGSYLPSEDLRPRLAKTLRISVDQLMDSLQASAKSGADPIASLLTSEEIRLLAEISKRDTRAPADEIRWLVRAYAEGRLVQAPGYTLK